MSEDERELRHELDSGFKDLAEIWANNLDTWKCVLELLAQETADEEKRTSFRSYAWEAQDKAEGARNKLQKRQDARSICADLEQFSVSFCRRIGSHLGKEGGA